MSLNALDTLIGSFQRTWADIPTPVALAITLLIPLFPIVLLYTLALSQRESPPPPPAGCKRLGLQGSSNLSDQYSGKYSQGSDPGPDNCWRVKALFIYPLKSCAPVELSEGEIIRTGFRYDRQFTLGQYITGLPSLDGKVESEWNFVTQRTFPRLAKVETEIWVPDPSSPGYSPDAEYVKSEGCLVIRFPFSPDVEFSKEGLKSYGKILAAKLSGKAEPTVEFRVPFNPTRERIKKMRYKSEKVKIWKDLPEALNMGPEVPDDVMAKLKYTLGITNPISLFRIDTTKYREVFKCAPKKADVGFQTIIGMQDSVRNLFHSCTPHYLVGLSRS